MVKLARTNQVRDGADEKTPASGKNGGAWGLGGGGGQFGAKTWRHLRDSVEGRGRQCFGIGLKQQWGPWFLLPFRTVTKRGRGAVFETEIGKGSGESLRCGDDCRQPEGSAARGRKEEKVEEQRTRGYRGTACKKLFAENRWNGGGRGVKRGSWAWGPGGGHWVTEGVCVLFIQCNWPTGKTFGRLAGLTTVGGEDSLGGGPGQLGGGRKRKCI